MRAKVTGKGQITIPIGIRRKFKLDPGTVLEFDEQANFVKASKLFDRESMYAVIGAAKGRLPGLTSEPWLNQTRGPAELPPANRKP